jgi:hypothetical protein
MGDWRHTARGAGLVALFACLVLATRFGRSPIEIIDWDEHTFMLVARSMLRGHLPYEEVFDLKPPLLLLVLAAAMRAFGESLMVVRLVGDVCVFVAVCSTVVVARRLAPRRVSRPGRVRDERPQFHVLDGQPAREPLEGGADRRPMAGVTSTRGRQASRDPLSCFL